MSGKETVSTESAAAPVEATPNIFTDAYYVTEELIGDIALLKGWKYRGRCITGINIPWYTSLKIQLGMVAFVCFLCRSMFNALSDIRGGRKTDATLADNINTALYSTFAVFGFFGRTFVNRLSNKSA
jgi:hypothetical protein